MVMVMVLATVNVYWAFTMTKDKGFYTLTFDRFFGYLYFRIQETMILVGSLVYDLIVCAGQSMIQLIMSIKIFLVFT